MNLDEIRKRMDRLQNKSNGKSKSDYKANFWKPPSGEKSVIRIVPYKHNKEVPFTELYFYFGIDKPRMMRFWEFGKMVYQELLGVMMDEDYGDITDIAQGRDVTVEVIPAAETGKMYDTTTVRVKPVQTPLADSAETIESLLENQKNVTELFNKYSFDEMKESLQKYLAPSEEQETVEATTPAKEKVDLDSKIDDLFG
jgi:hypothetical protein